MLRLRLMHLLFSQEGLTESCTTDGGGSCLFTWPSATSEGRARARLLRVPARPPSAVSDPGVNVL